MAKKGGLGRGLNSLLGSETDTNTAQEITKPVERVVVNPDNKPQVQQKHEPAPPESAAPEPVAPKPIPPASSPQGKEKAAENLYSNKEDNITIKGVVERAVEPNQREERKPEELKVERASRSSVVEGDEVSIDLVQPNPDQPRTHFNKQELEELAESIKRNGLLQPILVREKDGHYEIIAGERRWQACKLLDLKKVPIRVRNVDDDETIALALIENVQRSDLNPIEEAYGYRRMMERGKMTQSQVAQAVSKGRSTIANALRLLELPEEAQQLLFEEEISAGHARAILSIPTKEGRAKLTEKLVKEKLSVRETEAIARLMSGKKDEKKVERPQTPKSYRTVARSLRDVLQTDVKVKSAKGKNKIEIEFKDEADLERLFRVIAGE